MIHSPEAQPAPLRTRGRATLRDGSTDTRPDGYTVEVFTHKSTGVDIHYPDPTLAHLPVQRLEDWWSWTLEGNLLFKEMLNRPKDQSDILWLKVALGH